MNTGLFNEDMSYFEALNVLFASLDRSLSEEEANRIKQDFYTIAPMISRRELSGDDAVLTSYPVNMCKALKQGKTRSLCAETEDGSQLRESSLSFGPFEPSQDEDTEELEDYDEPIEVRWVFPYYFQQGFAA